MYKMVLLGGLMWSQGGVEYGTLWGLTMACPKGYHDALIHPAWLKRGIQMPQIELHKVAFQSYLQKITLKRARSWVVSKTKSVNTKVRHPVCGAKP